MAEHDYRRVRTARTEDEEREGFIRDRRREGGRGYREVYAGEQRGGSRSDRVYRDPIEPRAEFGRESPYGGYAGGYSPSGGLGEGRFYAERTEGRGRQEREGRSAEQGKFAGRGPKNYRRADERIAEDVNERLMEHPEIDAGEIEVSVKECAVTLSGRIDNRRAKFIAEDIAESVSGVKEVDNRLRVGMAEEERRTESQGEEQRQAGKQPQQPRTRAARR